MRVKFLAQEHNTISPAGALTRTARSGAEYANLETTMHQLSLLSFLVFSLVTCMAIMAGRLVDQLSELLVWAVLGVLWQNEPLALT